MTEIEKHEMKINITCAELCHAVEKKQWQRVNDLSKFFRKLIKERTYFINKKEKQNE